MCAGEYRDLTMLLSKVGRRLYRRYERYLYAFETGEPASTECYAWDVDEGQRIVILDGSDSHQMASWHGIKPNLRRKFDDMLKEGEVGFFLLAGEQVIGHIWLILNRGSRVVDRGYLRIYPGEAYAHHLRAYPQAGGRSPAHAMKKLHAGMRHELRAKGISVLKTSVFVDNRPAVAFTGALLGGRIAGTSTQWKVGGMSFRRIRLTERGTRMSHVRW